MKEIFETIPLVHNQDAQRFEIRLNGHLAYIEYEPRGEGVLALMHTEAAPELGGTGAAAALVEKTLLFLEAQKMLIEPFCPYLFAYLKKHPQWKRIVSKDFPGYHRL